MFGRRFGRDDAPADDRRGGVATATRDRDGDVITVRFTP